MYSMDKLPKPLFYTIFVLSILTLLLAIIILILIGALGYSGYHHDDPIGALCTSNGVYWIYKFSEINKMLKISFYLSLISSLAGILLFVLVLREMLKLMKGEIVII